MVVIRCSYTAPVNDNTSDNAQSRLTMEEFYQVLEAKSRNPLEFVEDFTDSRIVQEEKDSEGRIKTLIRRIKVKGFDGEFEEVITLKRPIMVIFEDQDPSAGSYITNIVSTDDTDPTQIYMTSTYEFNRPDLQEGSKEHQVAVDWYTSFGKKTVTHVVNLARRMKEDRTLPR